MPNNIAVITQEEFEPKFLPNPNLTMALPYLAPLLVPQFSENKLLQMNLWGKVATPVPPDHDFIQVQGHNCSSTQIQAHTHAKLNPNPMATRKRTRPSIQELDKLNIQPFPKCQMTPAARRVFNWHTLCTSRR
jgi:hypothetical protein